MKIYIFRLVTTFLVAITLGVSSPAWSKEKPVDGIYQMFNAFNKLEGEYRDKEWAKSLDTIVYIQTYFAQLTVVLKSTVPPEVVHKFGFSVGRLRRLIESRDTETIDTAYMGLQTSFLTIMDYYDYPSPPVLMIFARYVDEAKEGLEQKDFHEIIEEMKEISALKGLGIKAFAEVGVKQAEIDRFFAAIEKVERAAHNNDIREVQTGLELVEDLINKFAPESSKRE